MTTIPPSSTMQAHNLNSEVIKLAESSVTAYHCDRIKGTHKANKLHSLRRNRIRRGSSSDVISTAHRIHHLKICAMSQSFVDQIGLHLGTSSETEVLEKTPSYLFRTEIGGQVKVSVGRKNTKYAVYIEVSSLPKWSSEHNLALSWGVFRSDASRLMVLNSQSSDPNTSKSLSETTVQTPFVEKSLGRHAAELEFDSNQAPFYLSFLLHSSLGAAAGESGIRTHRKTSFCVPVGIGSGCPVPFGISFSRDGSVNFSLFSRNAERVALCLYGEMTDEPSLEIDLDPYVNRTGDIWHVSMENVDGFVSYGYRCKGDILWDKGSRFHVRHVLLDPYAKILGSFFPDQGKSISLAKCLGRLSKEPAFDWTGHVYPCLPMEKLVVYRLNVGRFTEDKSSQLPTDVAGTFTGLIKKLHHFKTLGVNAILLEPIFPFDEQKGPYLPYHFFSPLNSYGPTCDCLLAITSMKEMVKTLHANGIEVLLEVVFTSTAEGGDAACQTIAFRGIDNSSYYIVGRDAESAADNALNCNHPIVQRMILDSLQYWVTEFHIDGFCFMNAASLTQGLNGEHLSRPPLLEAIAFDPILSKTKIIADCWSPLEMSCKEIQFPHWKRWAEMNTKFCHDVRDFLRGEGLLSDFATRLCGSGDIFSDGRGPAFSFNFITRNFGFHLVDLVSFSSGDLSSQLSWNCGEEGPTSNAVVLETRLKQIRNFLFILFISLGVPVLNMGDECGQSTGGSLSDSDRKPFNWNSLKTSFAIQTTQFIAFLISLRMRRNDIFQKRNFMLVKNIDWRGNDQFLPKWEDPSSKFLAVTLKTDEDEDDRSDRGDLFIAFNASKSSESVILPQLPEEMEWLCLVDTSLPFPGFFLEDGGPTFKQAGLATYEIMSHSCALFEAKRRSS
ncbi:isoamylase 2, chloroplastic [Magnolia sinica]|uniref:isoamylase 2, chloroplastic n=1 Tax=Magnolia sinica TaxID=86752 RepID=UPI0026585533|nr:isoamylase 2, chloroplastic [Magnolia sinica]XP_058077800.1 isoamylase 2, chloroplastic [Magnolia sinica]